MGIAFLKVLLAGLILFALFSVGLFVYELLVWCVFKEPDLSLMFNRDEW